MSNIEFLNPFPNPASLPISQAGVAGDYMYTWGFGEVFDAADPKPGMRKVFEHIKALLAQKGLGFGDVVKVTALLTAGVDVWKEYGEVYREYFQEPYPCRTTIPVPSDEAFLEIDFAF